MLHPPSKAKLLLCSSVSLCLISAAVAEPAPLLAQQPNATAEAFQSNLASPLNALKGIQDTYGKVLGTVYPGSSRASRARGFTALEQIRSQVLHVRNSGQIPPELLQDTLTAITEAQTALHTDGAQTIAYSLGTVAQEVDAVQARLRGEKTDAAASLREADKIVANTPAKDHPTQGDASEQVKTADAQPKTTAQGQQPQPMPTEARDGQPKSSAQGPQPQPITGPARDGQPKEPGAMGQGSNPPPTTSAESKPSTPQNAIASMQRNDVVGKHLYDKSGNDVASIQAVRTGPDGKIQAVEVDVGGFLGIGSRRVAVPVDELQLKGDRIQSTSLTSDQINNLPHVANQ